MCLRRCHSRKLCPVSCGLDRRLEAGGPSGQLTWCSRPEMAKGAGLWWGPWRVCYPKQSRRDNGCWDKAERSQDDQSDWGGGSDSHWAENPRAEGSFFRVGTGSECFQLATSHVLSWEPEGRREGEPKNHYPHRTSNTTGLQEHLSSVVGPSCASSSEG